MFVRYGINCKYNVYLFLDLLVFFIWLDVLWFFVMFYNFLIKIGNLLVFFFVKSYGLIKKS